MIMTDERKKLEVSSSRRRELKNLAKGRSGKLQKHQQPQGEEKKVVVTTTKESLIEMMLAASSAEELHEWDNTYPNVLNKEEYEDVLCRWQTVVACNVVACNTVADDPAEESGAEAVAVSGEAETVAADEAVPEALAVPWLGVVETQPELVQTHLGAWGIELPVIEEPVDILGESALVVAGLPAFEDIDILADSAMAAEEAEAAIRSKRGSSRGGNYDGDELRRRRRGRRRKIRRPSQRHNGGAEFAEDENLPLFVPSAELVETKIFLAAAEEDLHEAWQEARLVKRLTKHAVELVSFFRERYEFHRELKKEARALEVRERQAWVAQHVWVEKAFNWKKDWDGMRRPKGEEVAMKRLLVSFVPTCEAGGVRYFLPTQNSVNYWLR